MNRHESGGPDTAFGRIGWTIVNPTFEDAVDMAVFFRDHFPDLIEHLRLPVHDVVRRTAAITAGLPPSIRGEWFTTHLYEGIRTVVCHKTQALALGIGCIHRSLERHITDTVSPHSLWFSTGFWVPFTGLGNCTDRSAFNVLRSLGKLGVDSRDYRCDHKLRTVR